MCGITKTLGAFRIDCACEWIYNLLIILIADAVGYRILASDEMHDPSVPSRTLTGFSNGKLVGEQPRGTAIGPERNIAHWSHFQKCN